MSRAVVTLARHRQTHNPETGGSFCSCGEWEGPFTLFADARSFAAHLVAALKADGLRVFGPATGEDAPE